MLRHEGDGDPGSLLAALGLASGEPDAVFVGRANLFLMESITVAEQERAAELANALGSLLAHPALAAHPEIGSSVLNALSRLQQIVEAPSEEPSLLRLRAPEIADWIDQGIATFTEVQMDHILEVLFEDFDGVDTVEFVETVFTEVRDALESDPAFGTSAMQDKDTIHYINLTRQYYWLTKDQTPATSRGCFYEMIEQLNFLANSESFIHLPGQNWAALCHAVAFAPEEVADDDMRFHYMEQAAMHYADNVIAEDLAEVMVFIARHFAERGEYRLALETLAEVTCMDARTDLTPQLADAAITKSLVHSVMGEHAEAVGVIDDFLGELPDPAFADRSNVNAHARVIEERARLALAVGETALNRNLLHEAAQLYRSVGNHDAADEVLRRA